MAKGLQLAHKDVMDLIERGEMTQIAGSVDGEFEIGVMQSLDPTRLTKTLVYGNSPHGFANEWFHGEDVDDKVVAAALRIGNEIGMEDASVKSCIHEFMGDDL